MGWIVGRLGKVEPRQHACDLVLGLLSDMPGKRGLVLTAGTAVLEPALGVAKRRIGARLGSSATAGEEMQNLLCGC